MPVITPRPPFRIVKKTAPPMGSKGRPKATLERQTISAVQKALKLPVDGICGPQTLLGIAEWEWKTGIKDHLGALSIPELSILLGYSQPTPAMKQLAASRRASGLIAQVPENVLVNIRGDVGARAADRMLALVGATEKPPGSNYVPEINDLILKAGFGGWYVGMHYAYCAITGSACLALEGAQMGKAVKDGQLNGAYCPSVYSAAKAGQHGLTLVPAAQCRKGTILLFDWQPDGVCDHFGFALGPVTNSQIETVEANTGPDSRGNQSEGDGVWRRTRPVSTVRGFALAK